jgi:hypothetical protein
MYTKLLSVFFKTYSMNAGLPVFVPAAVPAAVTLFQT